MKSSDPPYRHFAAFYRQYMNHVRYGQWARYLLGIAEQELGRVPARVIDLGCGDGELLFELMQQSGGTVAELVGVDGSAEMLYQARGRLPQGWFVEADLRSLSRRELCADCGAAALFEPFEWAVSSHDTLNYLTESVELAAHFRSLSALLLNGALYSLDLVSEANLKYNFAGKRLRERIGTVDLLWESEYNGDEGLFISRLHFSKNGRTIGEEIHSLRYYSSEEVIDLAATAGFRLSKRGSCYLPRPYRRGDDMINLHFRKQG